MQKVAPVNGIKKIREAFGLTQTQLAIYLEVSLSMVNMAEANKRILPVQALLKLNRLDAHLQAPLRKTAKTHLAAQEQAHALALHKQMIAQNKELAYQIALHEKKLEMAISKHQQALRALSFVQAMHHKHPAQPMDKKDAAWLQVLQWQALQNLQKHHPLQQAALQNKMQAMQTEQKGLHKLMKGMR